MFVTFTPPLPQGEGTTVLGSDGCEYIITDGCPIPVRPTDIDTVDGYSAQGTSDGTQLDANGDPIPAGAPIITFYDADGNVIDSKDCTELDAYGVTVVAAMDGTDAAGNAYEAGDVLIELPNGDVFCQEKTADTDTFAEIIIAGMEGVDAAGNDFAAGDTLIQLADGSLVCAEKTIDTNDGTAVQGVSDGTDLDADGNAIPAGSPIIMFYDGDGNLVNSKDCTDQFGVFVPAQTAGADVAGNPFDAGDMLLQLPSGLVVCVEKTEDINTQDGYSELGVSDGSQLDADGNPIPAGAEVINYYDAAGNYVNSKDCTDDDTFGVPSVADAAGTDVAGNDYAAGDTIVTFPGGIVVCVPPKPVALVDGGSNLLAPDGITLNPLLGKGGAAIDVSAPHEFFLHSDGPSGPGISASPVWCDDSDPCVHRLLDCDGNVVKEWKRFDEGEEYQRLVFGINEFVNTPINQAGSGVTQLVTGDTNTQGDGGVPFPAFTNPLPCPVQVTCEMRSFDLNLMLLGATNDTEIASIQIWLDSYNGNSAYRTYIQGCADKPYIVEAMGGTTCAVCVNSLAPGASYAATLHGLITSLTTFQNEVTVRNSQSVSFEIKYKWKCL